MRLFPVAEASAAPVIPMPELIAADAAFMHQFQLYPVLNASTNKRASELCSQVPDMAWGDILPDLPETYCDLQLGFKKVLFELTDPYNPADTVSDSDMAALCASLTIFADNNPRRLAPAIHIFAYNASNVYKRRLMQNISFWHTYSNHDKFVAIMGATYTDQASLLQIPRQRSRH
jgi:hypothetical protein